MNQALSLIQRVICLVHSCFYQLRNIAELMPTVSPVERERIIHASISSCLGDCNLIFTCLHLKQILCNTNIDFFLQSNSESWFLWSCFKAPTSPVGIWDHLIRACWLFLAAPKLWNSLSHWTLLKSSSRPTCLHLFLFSFSIFLGLLCIFLCVFHVCCAAFYCVALCDRSYMNNLTSPTTEGS